MPKERDFGLTPLDKLFETAESLEAKEIGSLASIPIDEIDPFPNHPFQVNDDASMLEMVESIKAVGLSSPVIVRQKEDGRYEMISGHRRMRACELAGIDKLPAIVKDMEHDEAAIYMVDSNIQREKILPSEKAFAYKIKLDALKRQGQRTDLTSTPVEPKLGSTTSDLTSRPMVGKLNTPESIGAPANDSERQVQRFIRLTALDKDLLQMVDEGRIAFRPAVELSYLSADEQSALKETIISEDATPSVEQAAKLKEFSKEGRLNEDVILSIMQEQKPNQNEKVKIPMARLSRFFSPDATPQKIEETIIKALELYRKRERDREAAR